MSHELLMYRCRHVIYCLLGLLHLNMASLFVALVFPMMPTLGDSHEATNIPLTSANLTLRSSNLSLHGRHSANASTSSEGSDRGESQDETRVDQTTVGIPREFPTALVVASSVAAVCILVFFLVSYYWHTRQLDSRARKLAIRMAADSEALRCSNCTPPPRPISRAYTRAASESSSQEPNMCEALTTEDERPVTAGSEGGRSSVVISESDTGDLDDIFDGSELPGQPQRAARMGSKSGRGAHRKWSRSSRKSSGPASLYGKRDSAVTDKEILTHFASRRHSTFFI